MNLAADPQPFRPAWWLRNGHAQTIWANRLHPARHREIARVVVPTGEGDDLHLFLTPPAQGQPAVLLLHGLEGSPESASVAVFARALAAAGYGVAAAAFRGALGTPPSGPRCHHAARTDDLDRLIEALPPEFVAHGVHLVGISLGGSLLGLWLAERGGEVPPELRAAALVSIPFDLAESSDQVARALGGVYARNFLASLIPLGLRLAEEAPKVIDVPRLKAARTVAEFDDTVIAPLHGFESAQAYYRHASVGPRLGAIRVPALLLSAADDPFHPPGAFPEAAVAANPALEGALTARGGHVGWLEGAVPGLGRPWAPGRLLRFLAAH